MIKVTTRYLASHFIPPFVIGFIFFVAFLITFYMFRIISLIVTKGIDVLTVGQMVLDLSVSFFPLATPLAVFFATVYTLNKLSEDSEIIAMRSFGMSKFKIYFPFLIVSLFIGILINSLNVRYIPLANGNFKNTIVKLTSTGMLSSIKSGHFFTDIPRLTLFAEGVTEEGNNFENVYLHLRGETVDQESVIFAQKGSLVKLVADEQHPPSLRLNLTDGNIVKIKGNGEDLEKILFKQYDFPVFSTDFAREMLNKDSMKTNQELEVVIEKKKKDLEEMNKLNLQTDDAKNEKKELKKSLVKTEIEYFSRLLSLPQIVLFVLLGFTLGIKPGRGKGSNSTIKAIVILIAFYGLYFFLISMAQRGAVSAQMTIVMPLIFLSIVSSYLYKKLDWVG